MNIYTYDKLNNKRITQLEHQNRLYNLKLPENELFYSRYRILLTRMMNEDEPICCTGTSELHNAASNSCEQYFQRRKEHKRKQNEKMVIKGKSRNNQVGRIKQAPSLVNLGHRGLKQYLEA